MYMSVSSTFHTEYRKWVYKYWYIYVYTLEQYKERHGVLMAMNFVTEDNVRRILNSHYKHKVCSFQAYISQHAQK